MYIHEIQGNGKGLYRVILTKEKKYIKSVTEYIFSNKQEASVYIKELKEENNDSTGITEKN